MEYSVLRTTIKFCGQCNIHPSPLVLRKVRWKLTWSKSLVKTSTTFGLHAVAHRWSANNHLKARFPLFPSWILEKKLLINMSFFPSSIPTGINIVILVGPLNVRGWKFRDRKQNTTSPLDLLFEPVSHRGSMYSVGIKFFRAAAIVVKAQLVPKCRVPPDDVVQGLLCYVPIE